MVSYKTKNPVKMNLTSLPLLDDKALEQLIPPLLSWCKFSDKFIQMSYFPGLNFNIKDVPFLAVAMWQTDFFRKSQLLNALGDDSS